MTGQSAFSGSSVLEIGAQIIHVTPPPPSKVNPQVPPELDRITLKALEKKVEARYQSAAEMLDDLRAAATALSGNGVPVASKTKKPTEGFQRATNAFATLTMSLKRQRFSLASVIPAFIVLGFIVWAIISYWPRSYYQPSAAAAHWYDQGTDNLRNGAYYQASKALSQAIEIDGNYALARARLAQAWTELDYTDKAKDELLAVSNPGVRSSLSPKDSLYLEAITAIATRRFADAVKAYTEIAKLSPDEGPVYVDLGYAYENDGDIDKALENYLKAIELNKRQYATAYLRAAIVYNRKQDASNTTKMLDEAERLYKAGSNEEGQIEVLRQRGNILRSKGRYGEAEQQFQQALDASRSIGNEAQQITSLTDLSFLASSQGKFSDAENYAQQAVTFAQQKRLENLAASGLIELGNSFSSDGKDEKAEQYYNQGIQFARANKGLLREAKGQLNLGALYIRTARVDDGLKLVQQALDFFQRENYPSSVGICLTQLGRGYRRKGDYDAAQQALNQKLTLALKGNTQPDIANTYFEIGQLRLDQEKYPDALEQYDNALKIYESVKNSFRIAFTNTNRARILVRLGRLGDAKQLLDGLFKITFEQKGSYEQLLPELHVIKAEMNLIEGNLAQAMASANEAVGLATSKSEIQTESKSLLGLVKAASGGGRDAKKLCDEAINAAETAGIFGLHSRALLAGAEAALKTNDTQTALSLAVQAQEKLSRGGLAESEWRAWQIASRASKQLGDTNKAEELMRNATNARSRLEQMWGPDAFKQYAQRPDIQVYFQ
jgi:tetratricopeptide (TPR) repeat protein